MPRYSLESLIVALLILWVVGWLVIPVAGGLIHLLLVVVLIAIVARVVQGQRL